MGRFIDCQMAVSSWGERAKFRRAKVGLLRKGALVYIAIFSQSKDTNYKFPIDPSTIEILPAAIRFKDQQKDLFIRQVSDEQRYTTMMREIKVLLKKDKLRQSGKGDTLDKLISNIPVLSAINTRELVPSRVSARLVAVNNNNDQVDMYDIHQQPNQSATSDANHLQDSYSDCNNLLDHRHSIGTASEHLVILGKEEKQRLANRQLRIIKISGINMLPHQLWLRDSLHVLTLTDCNLTMVPKQLELFSQKLTSLDLSRNRISELPRSFCCKMVNLEELNLSHNRLETLPIEIKFFRRLHHLNIENNRLRMLPSTFSDLKNLIILNVAHNNLSQLPAFRKDEIRLKQLDVSFNPLDGASNEFSTFEVFPCYDGPLGYLENRFESSRHNAQEQQQQSPKSKLPTLFETTLLNVVRNDDLLKLASEESLPTTIVSTMQRDIFKCYTCKQMNILPAYNSTDILDYVEQAENFISTGNYRHGMTFMKLMCRDCFHGMSSR